MENLLLWSCFEPSTLPWTGCHGNNEWSFPKLSISEDGLYNCLKGHKVWWRSVEPFLRYLAKTLRRRVCSSPPPPPPSPNRVKIGSLKTDRCEPALRQYVQNCRSYAINPVRNSVGKCFLEFFKLCSCFAEEWLCWMNENHIPSCTKTSFDWISWKGKNNKKWVISLVF